MGYVYAPSDTFAFYIYFALTLLAVTLVGLIVAICGWAGARAGMVFSVLVGLLGLGCLAAMLMVAYWMWWICVPAIYLAWLGFNSWRRRAETSRRQPFHFGLSAMFLFVLVVALVVGGVTIAQRGQAIEDKLIAQFERRPGNSVYQANFGRPTSVIIAPNNELELREAVEILKQFTALNSVQLNGGANLPPAETVALMSELTGLRTLLMQGLPVNDADLVPLAKLKRLEMLELHAVTLTDAGLPNLYPLKRLNKLWLNTPGSLLITPGGMRKLHNELPNLDK